MLFRFNLISRLINKYDTFNLYTRSASTGCLGIEHTELTPELKHRIEAHWKNNLGASEFDDVSTLPKKYILSMFPYPSGNLHMGHVRVYAISDAMARFYRMNGFNVLHPMGWDAFGLPAENAAIQRNVAADEWTQRNITEMRDRFGVLGCSFDWSREFATCDPKYFKWTQWLFLQMHKEGLAYQKEALVNWDPVDQTVLADEQVDANGCSWRSGAKVEKKLLKQWFIKTTKFAKSLLDGLDDASLEEWRDIIKLQKHWIGECDGYSFDLSVEYPEKENVEPSTQQHRLKLISVWTQAPEDLKAAAFIAVTSSHILTKLTANDDGLLSVRIANPFGQVLPVVVVRDDFEFPVGCDTYLGIPSRREIDREIALKFSIKFPDSPPNASQRDEVLQQANALKIGGFPVSSKLKDWPISRQRFWGTPIPVVHCTHCGSVPIPDAQLPVVLPTRPQPNHDHLVTSCPKCGDPAARRESDTMDTFVDSSWYFLRFADPHNDREIFAKDRAAKIAPVDLYVGGKEHAVLHLYYARFVSHFLHSIGLVNQPEPFLRLLVQGMVMGRSYRVRGSGKYVQANEVRVINAKKNQAEELATGQPVVMQWEKMSKSKFNGVEPGDVIREHGTDSVRLIILGDVAPTSHRNWSEATFPGILGWQKRLWLTIQQFREIRANPLAGISEDCLNTEEFLAEDAKLYDSRNYFLKEATFNYRFSHQLSVAISKMQGLTNSIRRAPKDVIKYGAQYERALAAVIQMIAPMAPHFASELWAQFLAAPNRINVDQTQSVGIDWTADVLRQRWPSIDPDYTLDLVFRVNGADVGVGKYTRQQLARLTPEQALDAAMQHNAVQLVIRDNPVVSSKFVLYPECEAVLSIAVNRMVKEKKTKVAKEKVMKQ